MHKGIIVWGPKGNELKLRVCHVRAANAASGKPVIVIDTSDFTAGIDIMPGWSLLKAVAIPSGKVAQISRGFAAVSVNHVRDGQSLRTMSDFHDLGLQVFASMDALDDADARRALASFAGNLNDWKLLSV